MNYLINFFKRKFTYLISHFTIISVIIRSNILFLKSILDNQCPICKNTFKVLILNFSECSKYERSNISEVLVRQQYCHADYISSLSQEQKQSKTFNSMRCHAVVSFTIIMCIHYMIRSNNLPDIRDPPSLYSGN